MGIDDRVINAVRPERVVELTRAICSIPSPLGCEGEVGDLVAELLDRPGIEVHLEDVVDGRPNVTATVRGEGLRPPLVLNAHMDATIEPDGWTRDPFTPWTEDGRLHAAGVTDMKGALASMVAAVEAAAELGGLPGDVILQAVMHHDGTGLGTKYALAAYGPHAGFAICGEPSDMAIHTANGGAVKFEVALRGRSAHVCRYEDGADTIPAALSVWQALSAHAFEHEPHSRLPDLPRILIGELGAGSYPAHVAETAVIRGDVRTVPGLDRDAVGRQLNAVVAAACPANVTPRVRTLSSHRPFLGATEGPLVDAIQLWHMAARGGAARVTNEMPGQAFVTDAADLAFAGLETVVYGPGVWRHAPDEAVAIDDLVDAARVYLGVSLTLGAQHAGSEAPVAAVAGRPSPPGR